MKIFKSVVTYTNGFTFDEELRSKDLDMTVQAANDIMWTYYEELGINPDTIKSIVTTEQEKEQ